MPRGDRTGPEGRGPLTGRRAGYCAGYDVPGNMNERMPPNGMGWGRGRGGGQGWGWGPGRDRRRGGRRGWARPLPYVVDVIAPAPAPASPQDEVTYLEGCADQLEAELKAIKERLKELRRKE